MISHCFFPYIPLELFIYILFECIDHQDYSFLCPTFSFFIKNLNFILKSNPENGTIQIQMNSIYLFRNETMSSIDNNNFFPHMSLSMIHTLYTYYLFRYIVKQIEKSLIELQVSSKNTITHSLFPSLQINSQYVLDLII